MKRVLTAAVLIPAVLVLVFLPSRWQPLFVAATALVSALAAWEYLGLARGVGAKTPRIAVLISTVLLFAAWWQWQDAEKFISTFGILSIALLIYCTFASPITSVLSDAASSVFCLFYTGVTMISIPLLREQSNGPSLVLYLFCIVWSGDSAAYYVGRTWGRHKMAPSLSPGKTWEGAAASVLGSVIVAVILVSLGRRLQQHDVVMLSYPDAYWYWILIAVVVNAAGQVGDLAESALKRSAGVKDSGDLLPGHGGMLDRIDALLFAAPVLWYALIAWQKL